MLEFIFLIRGLSGLWFGSELLIRGAISLSDRFNVSDAVIGMLILAVGTDLPELFVAFDASFRSLAGEDLSGIVIGTAIGSSIGQFGLVLGVTGFIGFAPRPMRLMLRSSIFLIGGLLALTAFCLDGVISRVEGYTLSAIYCAYLFTLIFWKTTNTEQVTGTEVSPVSHAAAFIIAGLTLLLLSAELTVVSARDFAALVGLSNLSVSAIIIGMGSSLPELSVCIIALMKNRGGLSVGNLMGSNVLDTFLVPGVGAAISPLVVPATVLWLDLPVLALLTVLVLGFLYVSPRGVRKVEASTLVAIYCSYAVVRVLLN
jgi:cation:H+ antiporter